MDNEMIERCAKAIFDKRYQAPGSYQYLEWEKYQGKEFYREDAIQCFKAMREPTEKMILYSTYESNSANTWRAMIDAITGAK